LVIVVAIERFGRAISFPTEPHLDATLDVVLGLVLVNVAVLVLVFSRCGNAPNEAAVLGISRCAGAWSGSSTSTTRQMRPMRPGRFAGSPPTVRTGWRQE
jgi:hypothetical protein